MDHTTSTLRTVTLPYAPDKPFALLTLPVPLSEEIWRLMLAILEAMRPGIVAPDAPEDRSVSAEPQP
jgi:hypothetical protein